MLRVLEKTPWGMAKAVPLFIALKARNIFNKSRPAGQKRFKSKETKTK